MAVMSGDPWTYSRSHECPRERKRTVYWEYVTRVRERMELARELVQQNMAQARMKQKEWYDQKAREMQLQPRDKVLVFLPTSTHKLRAQWQGPYLVKRAIGRVNYEVAMPEPRKPNVIFYVNMLKRWVEPELVDETGFLIEEADDESSDRMEIPDWRSEPVPDNMHNGKRLSLAQQQELKKLLEKFTPIMSDNPGRTHLIEHHIRTSGKKAIRQPPYRLPQAFQDEVIAELQDMVKAGIILPSQSEWAFPMVIVKKKNGKARICIDYRKLNAVTEGDAYPMPRIDDILDDLRTVPIHHNLRPGQRILASACSKGRPCRRKPLL